MEVPEKSYLLPIILFSISAALIVFALIQKNSNFMYVRAIIKKHFSVFKGSPLQFIVLFVVPLFLAIASVQIKPVNENIINNLNVVLAILISMFFAMLSILSAFPVELDKKKDEKSKIVSTDKVYDRVLGETFNSIMFECIQSILVLICSCSILFFGYYEKGAFLNIISTILYYLFFVLVLNIFVIIKRMMALFVHLQRTE